VSDREDLHRLNPGMERSFCRTTKTMSFLKGSWCEAREQTATDARGDLRSNSIRNDDYEHARRHAHLVVLDVHTATAAARRLVIK